jgi:hypothetical protein
MIVTGIISAVIRMSTGSLEQEIIGNAICVSLVTKSIKISNDG